jgi:large subunit ribosomal protein L29
LGIEELQTKVLNLKKDLMQLRFQQKTGKLERQNALSQTKRDIARILTVINETKKAGKKK